jgi:hypothetical protein
LAIPSRGTSARSPTRRSVIANAASRDHAEAEQRQHARVGPAPVGRLIERQQQRDQAGRERRHADVVEPLVGPAAAALADVAPGDQAGQCGDRQVGEQDPAPAQRVGEHAADQRPGRVAEAGRPDDQRARERGPLGRQDVVGHAEHGGPHQRAADPHQRSAGDQPELVLGCAREQGEGGEDRRADEEHAPAPEHVGQAAAADDQHAEHERVGVDHPLDGRDVRVELLLDLRQCDAERGHVVGDHEHRDRHRPQRERADARHGADGKRKPRGRPSRPLGHYARTRRLSRKVARLPRLS